MLSDFEKVLIKTSDKIKDLPSESIFLLPELEVAITPYGYSFTSETDKLEKYDNEAEALIEETAVKLRDRQRASFISTVFRVMASVLLHVVMPLANNIMFIAARGIASLGLQLSRMGLVAGARVAIAMTTTFISYAWSAVSIALRAIPHIIKYAFKLALKNPVIAASLAAAGITTAGYVAYKYFSQSKEKRQANLERAKQSLGVNESGIDLFSNTENVQARKEIDRLASLPDESFGQSVYRKYVETPYGKVPLEFTAETEIYETMRKEGWDKLDTSSARNYSKFGINANRNRSKEFIRNLTPEQAYAIYKKEYWDASGVENLPSYLRRMYFNTAVNLGVNQAKRLYQQSDGTLEGFATARWNYYNKLAQKNPFEYRKYLKGWRRRLIREYNESIASLQGQLGQNLPQKVYNVEQSAYAPVNEDKVIEDTLINDANIFALDKMLFAY